MISPFFQVGVYRAKTGQDNRNPTPSICPSPLWGFRAAELTRLPSWGTITFMDGAPMSMAKSATDSDRYFFNPGHEDVYINMNLCLIMVDVKIFSLTGAGTRNKPGHKFAKSPCNNNGKIPKLHKLTHDIYKYLYNIEPTPPEEKETYAPAERPSNTITAPTS